MYQGGLGACPLENFEILVLKTHLDGTIHAYNHRTQLAYVKTFEHPNAHNFYLTSTMCCMNVASLIYMTQSVVKSQRMLVVHDSCMQKSFRLNWPLKCISRILQQKLECLNRTQTSLNFGFFGVISKEKQVGSSCSANFASCWALIENPEYQCRIKRNGLQELIK